MGNYKDNQMKVTAVNMKCPVMMRQLQKLTSKDFKFAITVTMFKQLLKDFDFKGGTYL